MFVQAPLLENVTALPEPPPVAATVNWPLKTAARGACVVTEIAWSAGLTVSELEPELGPNEPSPGNEALTAVAWLPAPTPARLTFASVATPLPFVIAPPTLEPFSEKWTVSFGTGLPAAVNVDERGVVVAAGR